MNKFLCQRKYSIPLHCSKWNQITRGPKGHISCTRIQCATFLMDRPGLPFLFTVAKKNNVEFPLNRLTLFYGPDPTDFIGKIAKKPASCC